MLSLGIALTCADADRLIDLPSEFLTGLSFSSATGAALTRIWPTPIIRLKPAAVTESQRQAGYRSASADPAE